MPAKVIGSFEDFKQRRAMYKLDRNNIEEIWKNFKEMNSMNQDDKQ